MKKVAFVNGIILDGTLNMEPVKDKVIFVNEGKIEKISENTMSDALAGYEVIDLGGKYIMPGLINMHVHVPGSGNPKKKASDSGKAVKLITSNGLLRAVGKKMCESYCKMELMSGTTTIRSVGGILDWDSYVRDRINAGKADGPRILAANMAVSVPKGHMAGSLAYEAKSEEEAVYYVKEIAKGKPDLIKLMITGGVLDATVKGEPGVLKMPATYVKAACDEAHKLGLMVAAHVESPEGVRVALLNGVDTIEHGAKPDDEIIRLFKEKKAAHIATISPAIPYALFDTSISGADEMSKFNGDVVFNGIIDCAKACLANDIPVGLGTDVGCDYVTHYNTWMELAFFVKFCGVSNSFALHSATQVNATIAGIGDVTGTVEEGKDADLIVTEGNPLEDLTTLANVKLVMARGRLYKNPQVKKNPLVEQEMMKFVK